MSKNLNYIKGGMSDISKYVTTLQAVFRGRRERNLHVVRARMNCKTVCPFQRTPIQAISIIINTLCLTSKDTVLDIGCGDGSVLIQIALQTGATCIGIEIDSVLCQTAQRLVLENKVNHLVKIINSDIDDENDLPRDVVDFTQVTTIVLFLLPSCLENLYHVLQAKCTMNHIKIITYKFPIPCVAPNAIYPVDLRDKTSVIYTYTINNDRK